MKKIKRIFQSIYKKLYNLIYLITRNELDENKAIIVISRGTNLEGNLLYIYKELEKTYPEIKVHFIVAENKMNFKLFKELLIIKDAKHIILDDYYLPVYLLNIKKGVKVIQVWHAAGALKKFGFSTVDTKFGPSKEYLDIVPIHSNYTHVYVSSEHVKQYYAEAFNMSEERIHAYGIPRSDSYLSSNNKEIPSFYKELDAKNKVIILWAPTYRAKKVYAESNIDIVAEIKNVLKNIKNEVIIVYKPHPYTEINTNEFEKHSNFIMALDQNINDLMLNADALITDYSSVVFEYSLLKRPFVHYVPDIEEYTENRGFYESLYTVSDGVIIEEIDKLIKWINLRKKNEYFETKKMITYNFSNLNNPTQKIVNDFMNKEVR